MLYHTERDTGKGTQDVEAEAYLRGADCAAHTANLQYGVSRPRN